MNVEQPKHQAFFEFSAQGVVFKSLMELVKKVRDAETEPADFELLPIAVFMAFTIEAYVNSIGTRKVRLWSHMERSPWKTKINILHEASGNSPDWGAEPLQLAAKIFSIRDALAHGKTTTIPGPIFDSGEEARSVCHPEFMKPPILKGIDRAWALRTTEALYGLLNYLGGLFGHQDDDFTSYVWAYTKPLKA